MGRGNEQMAGAEGDPKRRPIAGVDGIMKFLDLPQ